MLKALLPPLLAAILGAVIGGAITESHLGRASRDALRWNAYNDLIAVGVRALAVRQKRQLTGDEVLRFGETVGVLTLHASDEVNCRAQNFHQCLIGDVTIAKKKYGELAYTMRKELKGKGSKRKLPVCKPLTNC